MSTTTRLTADQLLQMPDDGQRYELVAGELRKMSPANWKHGAIVGRIHTRLGHYIEEHHLGRIFGAETGFLIERDPDTVRAPDVAFIRQHHLPPTDPDEAYWPGAPDLAVEVVSSGDSRTDVANKVAAWLDAGSAMIWVVDAKLKTVTVHRSATDVGTFSVTETVDGDDLLPGFQILVSQIFELA